MKRKSWSSALEHGDYAENKDLVIKDAIDSVAETASGYHVNLVTPSSFGDPDLYLTEILKETFGDLIKVEMIAQCGCGGFVLRVWVE